MKTAPRGPIETLSTRRDPPGLPAGSPARGGPGQARSSVAVRLQKVLADRGVASRRHAEVLIAAGRVTVDGAVVTELGTKAAPDARIQVDGRPVSAAVAHRYIALNKPLGILSSARAERGRQSVTDLVRSRERLYPVGRLDVDSEGLILLTNDGEWAERLLHPRYGHEREYDVRVAGELVDAAVARMRRGIRMDEGTARAERIQVVAREARGGRLRVVLRTGWKRQVRRMCTAVGLRVRRLVRVRIGPLELGTLAAGRWRELTEREVRALERPSHERVPREERVRTSGAASREARRSWRAEAPAPGRSPTAIGQA